MDRLGKKATWVFVLAAIAIAVAAVLTRTRSGQGSGTGATDSGIAPAQSGDGVAGPRRTGPVHVVDSPLIGSKARVTPMPRSVTRLRADRKKALKLAREYLPDPEGRDAATVKSIAAELKTAKSSERKLELVEELAEKCHRDALPVVHELLSDPDPEVRAEALWALEGYTDPAVVPLALEALKDPDPEVRQAALGAIAGVKDAAVKEPLEQALEDAEESVRDMASEVTADLGTRIRLEMLEDSVKSEYGDVRMNAVEQLEDMASPYAFDVLIKGLRNATPEMKDFVNESIYFLVSESFDSYDAAKTWWETNRNRYDENLFETD